MRRALVAAILAASLLTWGRASLAQPPTGIVISEIAYTFDEDWVELHHRGPDPVSLEGWLLISSGASQSQVQLSGTISPGQFLVVVVPLGLRDDGDALLLLKPGGEPADAVSYGVNTSHCSGLEAAPGESLQLADLSASQFSCYFVPGPPSPGAPPPTSATPTPIVTPSATPTVSVGALALTEINYQGGCEAEWLELTNRSEQALHLVDWSLSDNSTSRPLSLDLAPGEVVVFHGYSASPAIQCGGRSFPFASTCLGNGLADSGDRVELRDATGRLLDALSFGDDSTHGVLPPAPLGQSLARHLAADGSLGPWAASTAAPGCLQAAPTPTATPTSDPDPEVTPTPLPPQGPALRLAYLPLTSSRAAPQAVPELLISEVLYQGTTADEGDEFVELRSFASAALDLSAHKLGDAERQGDGEGMYSFPHGTQLSPGGVLVIARCANSFRSRFGRLPDLEFAPGACVDTAEVPNMERYTAWGRGSISLSNTGDEVLLLGADDTPVDAVAFGAGSFGLVGLAGEASAPAPLSLHRVGALDRDDMSLDFGREGPSPGVGLDLPAGQAAPPGPSWSGMSLYWGNLHAHSSYSDGAGPPELAFARARQAGLHFYAITDHSHMLRPEEWSRLRGVASDSTVPGHFLALAGFEWTHRTRGHVNVLGSADLASREDPGTSDLAGFLAWARARPEAVLQSNHPARGDSHMARTLAGGRGVHLPLQEVVTAGDAARQEAWLLEAWANGWRAAPTGNPDTHDWLWGTDSTVSTGVWATELTEVAVLDALRRGRVFASEDANLGIGWRCGEAWMGEAVSAPPEPCTLFYTDADGEPATVALRDLGGGTIASWRVLAGAEGNFTAPQEGAFWLSVVQDDGDQAWTAPLWTGE
ncbi:MAG: lamin tail domain-containing protein [Anaerolineae bacterium]